VKVLMVPGQHRWWSKSHGYATGGVDWGWAELQFVGE